MLGQNTLHADFGPIVLTGTSRVNTAWGYGPYFDQPFDMEGDQYAVYADDTPIPTGSCDYGTITT